LSRRTGASRTAWWWRWTNARGSRAAIATVLPRADIQKCIVHQIRASLPYATRRDYAALALALALRPLYQAPPMGR